MLDFYAVGKEIITESGQKIIVKRAGVGNYYRLLYSLLELRDLTFEMNKIIKYVHQTEERRLISEYIVKINQINELMTLDIEAFINVKWKKVKEKEKDFVIENILNFCKFQTGSGSGETTKDQIEQENRYIVSFLISQGFTFDQAIEFNIYQAHALVHEWTSRRIQEMHDNRCAYHADSEQYKKYEMELRGFRFQTPQEILKGALNG